MANFLNSDGVLYLWQKVKELVTKNKVTKTSELTNDSGYITAKDVPEGVTASTTVPLEDGVASVGKETSFARGDHRHPSDTNKLDVKSYNDHVDNKYPQVQHVTQSELEKLRNAMTNEQITEAINNAVGAVTGISFSVVTELPATGEAGKIYLLAHEHGPQDNYDEYIYYSGSWEKIGNTDVDLSGYWAKADLVSITNTEIDTIVAQ